MGVNHDRPVKKQKRLMTDPLNQGSNVAGVGYRTDNRILGAHRPTNKERRFYGWDECVSAPTDGRSARASTRRQCGLEDSGEEEEEEEEEEDSSSSSSSRHETYGWSLR